MKQPDILRLLSKPFPEIARDIEIGQKLIKQGKINHAGEKYRDAARRMLSEKMLSFAIEYYTYASDIFISCEKFLKAINTEVTIYNVHKLNGNILEMANSYEKIASYYKHYLKDYYTAGWYYFLSAKHHEENQNYISAFKKAKLASECFEQTNNLEKNISSNNLAIRMALQSGYYEKAGEHALRCFKYINKDYSPHYLSVCVKGYKSFQNSARYEEALVFVNEIIYAHFDVKIPQRRIIKYLIEAQKLYLQIYKLINYDYNQKLIIELGDNFLKIANYSLELRQYSDSIGLSDTSDYFYLQQQKNKTKALLKEKYFAKYYSYKIWDISCSYGTSLTRWLLFSVLLIFLFGSAFSSFPCPAFFPEFIKNFLYDIHPEIKVASINNYFSPYYYSIVTFTTLGYGDITPENLSAQIFSVFEVFTGYIMLGGLLTVFAKKIVR
jgi:hypothetical protein